MKGEGADAEKEGMRGAQGGVGVGVEVDGGGGMGEVVGAAG